MSGSSAIPPFRLPPFGKVATLLLSDLSLEYKKSVIIENLRCGQMCQAFGGRTHSIGVIADQRRAWRPTPLNRSSRDQEKDLGNSLPDPASLKAWLDNVTR